MLLGDKIRKARIKKKITQETLARESEISLSYLFKIEKNVHMPGFDVVAKIAKVLKISLDSLS